MLAAINLSDLPENLLQKILEMYYESIMHRDWANRLVVDREAYMRFCGAAELLLP